MMLLILAVDSSRILRDPSPFRSRSDFEDYFEASRRLHAGEDLYKTGAMKNLFEQSADLPSMQWEEIVKLLLESKGVGAYLYPPFFAFLLTPIQGLDYKTAAIIFQMLSLAALALLLWLLHRRVKGTAAEYTVVLATLLYFPFLDDNASNGNVGFFLLLLCGTGILWSFREGLRSFLGGFLIGLATVIKIIPAFLAGILFAGRRFVALAGFVSGILFAVSVPAVAGGWQQNLDRHEQWYSFLIDTYQKHLVVRPYANNQTISAALSKLMIAGSDHKQERFGLPLVDLSLEQLPVFSMTVRLINVALVGSLGLLLLVLAWRRPVHIDEDSFAGILSLSLLTALVSSGVSWYHTYSLLLIPLALRMSGKAMNTAERIAYYGPAGMAILLGIMPFRWFEALSLYSFYTWVVLLAIILHHRMAWKGLIGRRAL